MRKTLLAILVLSAIGSGIAGYLAMMYYASTGVCTSFCETVIDSPYAVLFGIPVGLIGLFGFAALLAVAIYGFITNDRKALKPLFMLSTLSLPFVAYLVYLELAKLHQICTYCTATHFIVLAIWGLTLFELSKGMKSADGAFQ